MEAGGRVRTRRSVSRLRRGVAHLCPLCPCVRKRELGEPAVSSAPVVDKLAIGCRCPPTRAPSPSTLWGRAHARRGAAPAGFNLVAPAVPPEAAAAPEPAPVAAPAPAEEPPLAAAPPQRGGGVGEDAGEQEEGGQAPCTGGERRESRSRGGEQQRAHGSAPRVPPSEVHQGVACGASPIGARKRRQGLRSFCSHLGEGAGQSRLGRSRPDQLGTPTSLLSVGAGSKEGVGIGGGAMGARGGTGDLDGIALQMRCGVRDLGAGESGAAPGQTQAPEVPGNRQRRHKH